MAVKMFRSLIFKLTTNFFLPSINYLSHENKAIIIFLPFHKPIQEIKRGYFSHFICF
jgi:hypothetical protein